MSTLAACSGKQQTRVDRYGNENQKNDETHVGLVSGHLLVQCSVDNLFGMERLGSVIHLTLSVN